MTLQTVYDLWSARKFKKVGASTVAGYKASWARVSRFASKPIRKIGIDQWQSVIDEDEKNGFSKALINKDTLLIHALCSFAMERDWIVKDYSKFIELPTVGAKYEKGAFTMDEIQSLEQMAASGVKGADAALVLCYTGFRITEFLLLTPASYDHIEHTLTGGIKTEAGKNRVIPVHPKVQPYIDRWINAEQDHLYEWNGCSRTAVNFRRVIFVPLMEQLGQSSATPHWCRHTFASMLHKANANELNIKRLMGHSDKERVYNILCKR